MIRTGVVGGDSCVAGELIRLLVMHPEVELKFVNSLGKAGMRVADWHPGLEDWCELEFTDEIPLEDMDLLFFCTAEGYTRRFMESHNVPEGLKIVDLSADFRETVSGNEFEYGLPELNRRATCKARFVANPGACATAVLLGLLPLARHLMLKGNIWAHVVIGNTGFAGEPETAGLCGLQMHDNLCVTDAFTHVELPEIRQSLEKLQNSFSAALDLVVCRGGFSRGIFTTLVLDTRVALEEIERLYEDYYKADSFVYLSAGRISLRQVTGTNRCLIHLEKHGDRLLVTTCIDNLLKGSAGQAVHNMNLLFNLEETVGLQLKASVY